MSAIDERAQAARSNAASARAVLRAATQEVHLRLHRHPALGALARGDIGLDDYRRLLARLYGLHFPLERALIAAAALYGLAPVGARAHLLARDLLDLGATQAQIARLPGIDTPCLDGPGLFLGALYVREGSLLGATHLATALDPLLGEGEARGRRFLASGEAALWRDCCASLEAGAEQGLLPQIIDGADATFRMIERWLALPL
jgi:heme oxygenase